MITLYDIANCDDLFAEDSEVVDKYLQKIGLEDLLTPEDEQELLARAVEGDEVAFDKVMCANLRFTVSVANQYQNKGLSLLRLFEVSLQGLADAIKASASRPNDERFIQFAVPFMRQAIEEQISALNDNNEDEEFVISDLMKEVFAERGIAPYDTIRYRCSKEVGEEILADLNERCKELYSDEEIDKYREKYVDCLHDAPPCEILLYLEGFDVWKEDDGYLFEADQSFYVQYDSSTGTYYWNHAGYNRK